jgi:hypothetical protein
MSESGNLAKLQQLAEDKFGTIRVAESKLLTAAVSGQTAWVGPNDDILDEANDPARADTWTDRAIQAALIRWLCIDSEASSFVSPSGMGVAGARIEGQLNLSYLVVRWPMALICCAIPDGLELTLGEIRGLNLEGTHIGAINAPEALIEGSLILRYAHVTGGVNLVGAEIRGYLTCAGTRLSNPGRKALDANSASIGRGVFLNSYGGRGPFRAFGRVVLAGVRIDGPLDCSGGHFHNAREVPLSAQNARIKGGVSLSYGFRSNGPVDFIRAEIGGDLDCTCGCILNHPQDVSKPSVALNLYRARVGGAVLFNADVVRGQACSFCARGMVAIRQATIGNHLSCLGGRFLNPHGLALAADNAEVGGGVFLSSSSRADGRIDEFRAEGLVSVAAARVAGDFVCTNGRFFNSGNIALTVTASNIGGNLLLDGNFKADGLVAMASTCIRGSLHASGGIFVNPGKIAMLATSALIHGDVVLGVHQSPEGELHACQAQGLVDFGASRIEGNLTCSGGRFYNSPNLALNLSLAKVGRSVFLSEGFRSHGGVALTGVEIGGHLVCSGGRFYNSGSFALNAYQTWVSGAVLFTNVELSDGRLRPFRALGIVNFSHAKIDGDLDCTAAWFMNRGKAPAFTATLAKIGGSLLLDGARVDGGADLQAVGLGGQLISRGAWFVDRLGGNAFAADLIKVGGDLNLQSAVVLGVVSLAAATIGGDLNCAEATLGPPKLRIPQKDAAGDKQPSLLAVSATVGHSVHFRSVTTRGLLRLVNTKVRSDLDVSNAKFVGDSPNGLDAERAIISGVLFWRGISLAVATTLNLLHARVGVLVYDAGSWLAPKIEVDGFVYEAIATERPEDVRNFDWLATRGSEYRPQPYKQLAKVLREAGQEPDAKRVGIGKEKARWEYLASTQSSARAPFIRFWSFTLRKTIGYGYSPALSLLWLLGLMLFGQLLYCGGYAVGSMAPVDKDAYGLFKQNSQLPPHYESFYPSIYSLENVFPFVRLGQVDHWQPDPSPQWTCQPKKTVPHWLCRLRLVSPQFLRNFRWAQIFSGWFLATMGVAGVTGIVRKD